MLCHEQSHQLPEPLIAKHAAAAHAAAVPAGVITATTAATAAAVNLAAAENRLLRSASPHLQAKQWLQRCVWPHLLQ
jgi:hypothetical protein